MAKLIDKIWFEIKNMKIAQWGYDGMQYSNRKEVEEDNGDWVSLSDVLSIIDKYAKEQQKEEQNNAKK